jgi:hypothetical protein
MVSPGRFSPTESAIIGPPVMKTLPLAMAALKDGK